MLTPIVELSILAGWGWVVFGDAGKKLKLLYIHGKCTACASRQGYSVSFSVVVLALGHFFVFERNEFLMDRKIPG